MPNDPPDDGDARDDGAARRRAALEAARAAWRALPKLDPTFREEDLYDEHGLPAGSEKEQDAIADAWVAEVARRTAELDAHPELVHPAADVFREIRRRLG